MELERMDLVVVDTDDTTIEQKCSTGWFVGSVGLNF